jgi:hypothetical protein
MVVIEELYKNCLEGNKAIEDLTETDKLQLRKHALKMMESERKGLFDSLNGGFITMSMIGGDFDKYLKNRVNYRNAETMVNLLNKYRSIDIGVEYQTAKNRSYELYFACKKEAEEIIEISKKIEFWHSKKIDFLATLPIQEYNVSAIMSSNNKENQPEMLFDKLASTEIEHLSNLKPQKIKSEFTRRQSALIKSYKDILIIKGNPEYNKYRDFNYPKQRLTEPPNKKGYNDFIKDLEIVVNYLEEPYKKRALDELSTYIAKYENKYGKK